MRKKGRPGGMGEGLVSKGKSRRKRPGGSGGRGAHAEAGGWVEALTALLESSDLF